MMFVLLLIFVGKLSRRLSTFFFFIVYLCYVIVHEELWVVPV